MLFSAERVLLAGEMRSDVVIEVGASGRISALGDRRALGEPERMLPGRALIPGLIEAHADVVPSSAAARLDAPALRAVAGHRFVEMLCAGITSVGAVLAVHHGPDGEPYRDPSLMADSLALAARDAGIRMCLLRSVRLRGHFDRRAQASERREIDPSIDVATDRVTSSARRLSGYRDPRLSCGVAVGSLATVPPDALIALKTGLAHLPLHVGAAMDLAETLTCQTLFGVGPVELLVRAGIVDGCTTLVGVTGLRPGEGEMLAQSGGVVYSESAEVAAALEAVGVPVAVPAMSAGIRLDRVTVAAGAALAQPCGRIAVGRWADLVALDLEELGDTLPTAGLPVREVMVGGRLVVAESEHPGAANAAANYARTMQRLSQPSMLP